MSGTNTSVQLNQNSTDGAEMWVVQYDDIPGESTPVAAQVINVVDDQGNLVGLGNPLSVSGSVSVVNVENVAFTAGSVTVYQGGPWSTTVSGSVSVINQSSGGGAGSVSVLNFPADQTVNVTNFPDVQAVSQSGNWGASISNLPTVQSVSGSVSVLNPFTVDTISGSVSVQNFPVTQQVSQSGPWSASVQGQLPVTQATSPWIVSAEQVGSWGASVSNFPTTQAVAGSVSSIQTGPWYTTISGSVSANVTNFPTTQAVSGSVSVLNPTTTVTANQGNAPWTVAQSGNWGASVFNTVTVEAIQQGNWGASVSNFPPLQDTQIAGSVTTQLFGDPTYSATTVAPLIGVAGDNAMLVGSASKVVRVGAVRIQGSASVAAAATFTLIKRSAIDTGGTIVPLVRVPYDSSNAAATASVVVYTAAPTLGASVGAVDSDRVVLPSITAGSNVDIEWLFGERPNSTPITLRSATEALCVNLAAVPAGGGGAISITYEWTENTS